MKSLSLVRYHLRQLNFHDVFTHASNALKNEIPNIDDNFLLNFWFLVAATVINTFDLDVSHAFECLMDENRVFEYTILCALLWSYEFRNDEINLGRKSEIDLKSKTAERYASTKSILLAAEFFMYIGSYKKAEALLVQIQQVIYQKSSAMDLHGEFHRVSACLYTMSNGTTRLEPERFHDRYEQMLLHDLDCLFAIGEYFIFIGQHGKALQVLNYVNQTDESFFPVQLELSKLFFEAKNIDSSQEHLKLALNYCGNDFITISHSVILSFLTGHGRNACDILEKFIEYISSKEAHTDINKYSRFCEVVSQVSNRDVTAAELCISLMAHICESDPENTQHRLDFAHQLRRSGKYQDAISLYEFISSVDDSLDALEGMALSNALQGDLTVAQQQIELYHLMVDSSNDPVLNLEHVLLNLLLNDDFINGAVVALVTHIDRHYAMGFGVSKIEISTVTQICKIILQKYRYHLPEKMAELLNRLSKISEFYFNGEFAHTLAKLLIETDQEERALVTIMSFQERSGSTALTYILQAHAYLSMGNSADASGSIDQSVALDSLSQNNSYFIAVTSWYSFLNNHGENVKRDLQNLIFEHLNASSCLSWGDRKRCLLIYGHYDRLTHYEKMQLLPVVETEAKCSKCYDLIYLLSKLEVMVGSMSKAINVFDMIPRLSSEYSLGRYAKAWLYLTVEGDNDGFLGTLKTLSQEVASHESYVYLGQAHIKLGNNTEAFESFQRAISMDPDNEDLVISAICGSLVAEQESKTKVALDLCKRHLHNFPSHAMVKILMARLLGYMGEWNMSVDVYNDVLSSWDEKLNTQLHKIGLHLETARIYHDNNEHDLAIEVLQEAKVWCLLSKNLEKISTTDDYFHVQWNLAVCFVSQRNFTQAIHILEEITDRGYMDLTALKMLSFCYLECKMNEQCYNSSLRILDMYPNDEEARNFLRLSEEIAVFHDE